MSDEELLRATLEAEREQMTAGKTTTEDVPVIPSRDVVPKLTARRKAMLLGTIPKTPSSTSSQQEVSDKVTRVQRTRSVAARDTGSQQAKEGTIQRSQSVAARDSGSQQANEGTIQRPQSVAARDSGSQQANEDLCLPARWKKTLPKVDHLWVSKALFRWNQSGVAEIAPESHTQLWWHPPQPAVAINSIPGMARYFAQPLFMWMPRKQWKVKLYCPHPDCHNQELSSAGINKRVRQVTDLDGYYNIACDNLECMKCRRRVLSWSHAILSQLDVGHRVQFPCILTAKLACDMKVVRLLRNRGLGNSCSQLRKKLEEQHGEKWLQNVLHYLTDCSGFSSAATSSLVTTPAFTQPPERIPVPKYRWLMQIYIQDVLHRLDDMKAGITSVLGRILKIDSTKKVVKKLAGRPAKTALWCTNVGNEYGQVLNSVMTAGEGHGITPMMVGLINRYVNAKVPSPEALYTDRDCCGSSPLRQVLTAASWNTPLRLDIWHFMRRIATGCSTDSHQLYSSFMGFLSNCVFQWDEQDLTRLLKSKRNELKARHLVINNQEEVMKHLSRYELSLHCRRKTRGVPETTKLINQLIEAFSGEKGRDTLGVPLINTTRMKSIWEKQVKHIPCIQDPPGLALYIKTGSTKKGGIDLPNYRCARGSTSLECFHLHLNRFIPGTLASDVLFQAYMMDGLHRWNEDRARAATTVEADHQTYSGLLRHAANALGMDVLKRKIVPSYTEPRKFTGELIGIEYLYSQTGKVMEDYQKAIETLETEESQETITAEEEDLHEDTIQIDDLTISTVGLKDSSEIVLEPPVIPQTPVAVEAPPERNLSTPAHPILKLPTAEEYEALRRDTHIWRPTEQLSDIDPTISVPEVTPVETSGEEQEIDQPSDTDPTISVPEVTPVETSGEEQETDESVGPDGIPGYGKIQEFAAYLIGVRHDLYLTNAQASQLINLWNNLHNYDKAPTVFAERFSREARGRFKAKKTVRRNVVPGVESTERIMCGGPGAVPASWPGANRYTEAIIVQLMSTLPRNRTRYDDVTRAYYNIRQLVLENYRVTTETRIQLPEISRGTLLQWYTKRGKELDKRVVTQGVRFKAPLGTTSDVIPVALEKPGELPSGRTETHSFVCPSNTAGMARFKGQKKVNQGTELEQVVPSKRNFVEEVTPEPTSAIPAPFWPPPSTSSSMSSCPIQPEYTATLLPSAPAQLMTVSIDGQALKLTTTLPSTTNIPYTTQRYRKRKQQKEKEGIMKRKYERKNPVHCKKCGQERIPPSHQQYFMNWFCSLTSTINFESWREDLKKSKKYGEKKKPKVKSEITNCTNV